MLALPCKPAALVRGLATISGSKIDKISSAYSVFDRNAKRMQKDRAALREGGSRSRAVDYLFDEVADRLAERLAASIKLVCLLTNLSFSYLCRTLGAHSPIYWTLVVERAICLSSSKLLLR